MFEKGKAYIFGTPQGAFIGRLEETSMFGVILSPAVLYAGALADLLPGSTCYPVPPHIRRADGVYIRTIEVVLPWTGLVPGELPPQSYSDAEDDPDKLGY